MLQELYIVIYFSMPNKRTLWWSTGLHKVIGLPAKHKFGSQIKMAASQRELMLTEQKVHPASPAISGYNQSALSASLTSSSQTQNSHTATTVQWNKDNCPHRKIPKPFGIFGGDRYILWMALSALLLKPPYFWKYKGLMAQCHPESS